MCPEKATVKQICNAIRTVFVSLLARVTTGVEAPVIDRFVA